MAAFGCYAEYRIMPSSGLMSMVRRLEEFATRHNLES